MAITIYQMPHSPYCIPITQALIACNVDFLTIDVTPHTREEVIAASGGKFYQVPLLTDGARVIGESRADSLDIARYIDRKFARGRLFPKVFESANFCLTRYAENELEGAGFRLSDPFYIDSITDPVARTLVVRHKERAFGRGCVEAWRRDRKALAEKFDALLGPFETTLRNSPFLLGEAPVYADFALFGVIGNATWNGWNRLHRDRVSLAAWRKRLTGFRFSTKG
ncbi:MAG: glutathione S-transferase family protein [Terrimicrobiaceae bacterium]|nr:glutathione S-transferase family protein [Terrimicrobiaceae bacterium]